MKQSAKEAVLTFIKALNEEDFEKAGACLDASMEFDGVMGKRNGADAYMTDMKKMKFKYDILQSFENENEVCLLYNIDMSGKATIFTCGWYHVTDGRIRKLKVVFDPRPLLEGSNNN